METSIDTSGRVVRGKNWSDEETRIFITVLRENFSNLQGRKRKAKIFHHMTFQLKNYGIERTVKELQNKYKSMLTAYRSAASSRAAGDSLPSSNSKWFNMMDTFINCTIANASDSLTHVEPVHGSITMSNSIEGSANEEEQSEVSAAGAGTASVSPSESLSLSEIDDPQDGRSSSIAIIDDETNPSAKKIRLSSQKVRESFETLPARDLQLTTAEVRAQLEISTQVQKRICSSIESFSQIVESLSGTLALIPTLISQLMQQQPTRYALPSTQSNQPISFILSPAAQIVSQSSEQGASNSQYLWVSQQPPTNGSKISFLNP